MEFIVSVKFFTAFFANNQQFKKKSLLYYRSFDERYRTKISQIEERFSQEKKDLLTELEKVVLKVFYIAVKILKCFESRKIETYHRNSPKINHFKRNIQKIICGRNEV